MTAASPAFAAFKFTTLTTFDDTNGAYPYAGLTVSGGTLYGTTHGNSGTTRYGTVFSLPVTGGAPTILAKFNGVNGAYPLAELTLSGNTLYGTTYNGGANNYYGTVFSVPVTGGSLTTLASFNNTNGANPQTGLVLSGNTLYGTTFNGGAGGLGTVFAVPITGGAPTTLVTFNNTNGARPLAGLVLSGNTLYGTTNEGGANGIGTVFSVPLTGGSPTTLATFNNTNGAYPHAGLAISGNTLYGTTYVGGANNYGTVFSVPLAGGALTTLATFKNTNGASSEGRLSVFGNTLVGTTHFGGANDAGTVFSVPLSGGTITTLATFNGTNGSESDAGLTVSGNTLYGTTHSGGASGYGTIFSLAPNPVISLTSAAPTAFGTSKGTLTLTRNNGKYVPASTTFAATSTGYLAVTGFNPSTDPEAYALKITDSVPANLATDLADLMLEINAASYSGFAVTASTTDPLSGYFAKQYPVGGYNFYLTVPANTLGTGSPYLGFDLTQLNGISDTLSVTSIAAVPEPGSLIFATVTLLALLRRRRSASIRKS